MMRKNFYMLLIALFMLCMNTGKVFAQTVDPPQDSVMIDPADSVITELATDEDTIVIEDGVPRVSDEVLKQRLNALEKRIPLTCNPKTRAFIDYFTIRNRNYCKIMERRRQLYFPIFEEYFKKYNVPDEMKYLAIVESGLNPIALSRVGAAGLWQFMPYTGKQFGLRQDEYIDERLDPYKSTEAACKYLKELYNSFNDWELALASYNCGPGNVRRAIRRSGYKDSFWEVYNYLPAETRGYVPQFVAITYTMNHLDQHNIVADSIEYPMQFDTLRITQYLNLERFCERMNICMEDMKKLNPALKKSEIPAYLNYILRIPKDKMGYLYAYRTEILDFCSLKAAAPVVLVAVNSTVSNSTSSVYRTKIYHTVKRGEVLGTIASKYRVSVTDVKKWNRLKSNTIQVGQKLVIYKSGTYKASTTTTASSSSSSTVSKTGTVYHTVKSGESLYSIATKYGVTIVQLKQWNNLSSSNIQPGKKLVIRPASSSSSNNSGTQATTTQPKSIAKYYTVQPGDTLWSISKKYNGLTVERIKTLNKLKDGNIKPGQKLIVS